MNDSVFGKPMENLRKRVDIKLVTDEKKLMRLTSKPTFVAGKIFDEQLVAVHKTRGHGSLTHHLHSETTAGNRRTTMTFARLRLIVLLYGTWVLTGCPFSYVPAVSQNLLWSLYHS